MKIKSILESTLEICARHHCDLEIPINPYIEFIIVLATVKTSLGSISPVRTTRKIFSAVLPWRV